MYNMHMKSDKGVQGRNLHGRPFFFLVGGEESKINKIKRKKGAPHKVVQRRLFCSKEGP